MVLSRRKIFQRRIPLKAEFFFTWIAMLSDKEKSREAELEALLEGNDRPDSEVMDHWLSTADDFEWLQANLFVVAIYHWIERELKVAATSCLGIPSVELNERFDDLKRAFKSRGIKLSMVKNYEGVHSARVLANSWKHSHLKRSPKLSENLCLKNSETRGHLESVDVRSAFAKKLGVSNPELTLFLEALVTTAEEFLEDLAEKLPAQPEPSKPPSLLDRLWAEGHRLASWVKARAYRR